MTTYRYIRVSTDGQTLDGQIAALKGTGRTRKTDRAALGRVLAALERVDILMASRLDRLAKSASGLLNALASISGG